MLKVSEFLTRNHEPFIYSVQTVYWMVKHSKYYILEENGTIVGCIFASTLNTTFIVTLVVIDKSYRGKGYVKKLIQCLRFSYPNITSGIFLTKHEFGRELYRLKLYVLPYNNRAARLLGVDYNPWNPRYLKYTSATISHYIGIPNEYLEYIIPYPSVVGTWYNTETNQLSSVRYFEFRMSGETISVGYLTYCGNPEEYADVGYHSNVDVLFVYTREILGYPFMLHDDKVTVRAIYSNGSELKYLQQLPIQLF